MINDDADGELLCADQVAKDQQKKEEGGILFEEKGQRKEASWGNVATKRIRGGKKERADSTTWKGLEKKKRKKRKNGRNDHGLDDVGPQKKKIHPF